MQRGMDMVTWTDGLTQKGAYCSGIEDKHKLDEILELHKRETVLTFGTRSNHRVTKDDSSKTLYCEVSSAT